MDFAHRRQVLVLGKRQEADHIVKEVRKRSARRILRPHELMGGTQEAYRLNKVF